MKISKVQGFFSENFDNYNLIWAVLILVIIFVALFGYLIYKIILVNI